MHSEDSPEVLRKIRLTKIFNPVYSGPMKNHASPERTMPLTGHIAELRRRLIISILFAVTGMTICFFLYPFIYRLLFAPFAVLNGQSAGSEQTLFITTIFEGFFTRLKAAFFSGLIVTFPVHVYHIIRFIFPGLKKGEKQTVIATLVVSAVLLPLGFYYGYYFIIPLSVAFLTGAGFVPENVGLLLNYGKNIFIIIQFLLAFMIIFQMPIVLVLVMKLNLVTRKTLWSGSRYMIVFIFVLSAILTPPDFISQVAVALPLVLLYFLALLAAKICRFGEGHV